MCERRADFPGRRDMQFLAVLGKTLPSSARHTNQRSRRKLPKYHDWHVSCQCTKLRDTA